MKLWYLDNEHTDYIVMAVSRSAAWEKLEKFHILPYGTADYVADRCGDSIAYNDMYEIDGDMTIESPNDVEVVL